MKYSYEFTMENNFAVLAEAFINDQFRNVDFNKTNADADAVLKLVSDKAWNDAMSYVRKTEFRNVSNEKAFEKIKNYVNNKKIPENYATEKIPDMDGMPENMKLGVWQKYASMVFKYLYCIQLMNIKTEFVWFDLDEYKKCKCPVDRLIARSVFALLPFDKKEERALAWFLSGNSPESDKYKTVCWNKISPDEYQLFQKSVAGLCESFKLIPIQFDLIFWESPNILDKESMKKYRNSPK